MPMVYTLFIAVDFLFVCLSELLSGNICV